MKLVFVIPRLGVGGAERIFTTLMKNLDSSKYQIFLVLLNKEGEFLKELPAWVTIHVLGCKGKINILKSLYGCLYSIKPDVVISTLAINWYVSFLIPFYNKKCIFICRESNLPSRIVKRSKWAILIKYILRITYKNFNKIICQSKEIKQDFEINFGIGSQQLVVINNPVDCLMIQNRLNENNLKISESGNREFNLIAVGRIQEQKRYDRLIDLMVELKDEDVMLTIVGRDMMDGYIHRYCIQRGVEDKVDFMGQNKNPYQFMKSSDLLVLVSEYEGFPNVALEANACGIPVIAFKGISGIEEIVEEGINGWMIANGSIKELAKKIRQLKSENLPEREYVAQIICKKFGIDQVLPKYEKVFLVDH